MSPTARLNLERPGHGEPDCETRSAAARWRKPAGPQAAGRAPLMPRADASACPARELAEAVRRVHAGLRVVDPSLATESLLEGPNPLTERERSVLR